MLPSNHSLVEADYTGKEENVGTEEQKKEKINQKPFFKMPTKEVQPALINEPFFNPSHIYTYLKIAKKALRL